MLQVFARDVGTTSPNTVLRVSEVSRGILVERPLGDRSAHEMSQINAPVQLQSEGQNAVINPDDYLIGDLNGVVCLPKDLAKKAISLMEAQVEADERIAKDLKTGMSFAESSKRHRASLSQP